MRMLKVTEQPHNYIRAAMVNSGDGEGWRGEGEGGMGGEWGVGGGAEGQQGGRSWFQLPRSVSSVWQAVPGACPLCSLSRK